jgi:hypothetical protein
MENHNNKDNQTIGGLVNELIKLYFKNIKIVVFLFIGFNALALLWLFLKKPVYSSKLSIYVSLMDYREIAPITNSLQDLIEEQNPEELGQLLKISTNDAARLKKIEVEPVVLKLNETKSYNNDFIKENAFTFYLQVDSVGMFDVMNQKLVDYIETNTFYQVSSKEREKNYKNLIAKLEQELISLEKQKELQNKIYQADGKGNLFFTSPTSISNSIIEIQEKKLAAEEALQTALRVRVIQPFVKSKKSINQSKTLHVFFASLSAALVSFVFILKKYINANKV